MNYITKHLYDFTNPSELENQTSTTTVYTNFSDFETALQPGDHVFYNNMKLPIWFSPRIFELSHHGIYVGPVNIPPRKQIVRIRDKTNKIINKEIEVGQLNDTKAILHVWPGQKKNAQTDLQYTSLQDFFDTALRYKSAAYIIRKNDITPKEQNQIVDRCKTYKDNDFKFDHLTNNCETLVNKCLYGDDDVDKLKSKQVESYKKLRDKAMKAAGVVGVVGVVGAGVAATKLYNKRIKKVAGGSHTRSRRRTPSRRTPSCKHSRASSRRTPSRKHNRATSRRTTATCKNQKCR